MEKSLLTIGGLSFSGFVLACIITTAIYCLLITFKAKSNATKNIVDNSAQHVTTVGVMFTFIGIIYALADFNVNEIERSIPHFLDGMKTAFITSIIGIGFSLFISRFIQKDAAQKSKNILSNQFQNISDNSSGILSVLTAIKENGKETGNITEAINALRVSVENSNSSVLVRAIENFSTKMSNFAAATENSQRAMQSVAEQLRAQTSAIQSLELTLKNLGEEQVARLSSMKENIAQMSDFAEKTYNNSVTLLEETRNYQAESLENERKQISSLDANTQKIMEMRASFDEFLDRVVEVFSQHFIKALNDSIRDLNQKLTEQFGDNFRRLNEAVFNLLTWQENYKETVEKTVNELAVLNNAFAKFSTDVAPTMADNAERLSESLEIFAETSARNIEIQESLTQTSQNLFDSVQATEEVADNLETIHDALVAQQQEILRAMENSFAAHKEKMSAVVQAAADDFEKILEQNQNAVDESAKKFSVTFSEVANQLNETLENVREDINLLDKATLQVSINSTDRIKKFGGSVDDIIDEIHRTLENFDTSFKKEIENAMSKLNGDYNKVVKESILNLSAALGKITERMVGNYTTLINRIDEVDRLISSRRL